MGMIGSLALTQGFLGNSLVYTPEHVNPQGKLNSAKLEFSLLVNLYQRDQPLAFQITAWGSLAEGLVRNLHPGKGLSLLVTPTQYKARVFAPNPNGGPGTPITINGEPVTKTVTGWNIAGNSWQSVDFGRDAEKIIQAQIQAGIRPAAWNDGGQGSQAWAAVRAGWKNVKWNGEDKFFYADVRRPAQGSICPVPADLRAQKKAEAANGNNYQTPGAAVASAVGAQAGQAQVGASMPGMPQMPAYQGQPGMPQMPQQSIPQGQPGMPPQQQAYQGNQPQMPQQQAYQGQPGMPQMPQGGAVSGNPF